MNNKEFKTRLSELGKISPSKSFKDKAKLNLLKKISPENNEEWFSEKFGNIESPYPSVNMKYSFFSKFTKKEQSAKIFWKRSSALMASMLVFLMSISSFLFFYSPTSADGKSYVESFNGIVEKSRNSEFKEIEKEETLNQGEILRTGENSTASIVFFEDSVIRMDENTQIEIKNLNPNPFINKIGTVVIELDFGKIWVKSMAEQNSYENFEVHSGDIIVTPQESTFDIYRNGNINRIRNFERSTKISHIGKREARTINLMADKKVHTSLIGIKNKGRIGISEYQDNWFKRNSLLDKNYIEKFLERELEKAQGSFAQNIALKIKGDNSKANLQKAKKDFFEAIRLIEAGQGKESEKLLSSFSVNLNQAIEKDPEIKKIIELELLKIRKITRSILPNEDLYIVKKILLNKLQEMSSSPEELKTELNKELLWEARSLALEGNIDLTIQKIAEFESNLSTDHQYETPQEKIAELESRLEEFSILVDIENIIGFNTKEILSVQELVLDNVLLANNKVDPLSEDQKEDLIKTYLDKINIYTTERGQQNVLREIFTEIEDTPENLKLLLFFKKKAHYSLSNMISKKIINIVNLEKQKALIEAN